MNNYIIVYPNELTHYGVRGMKWGVRKQLPLVGRRQGGAQKPQLNDAQRRQVRKERVKKAAAIGGTLAVAGLAAYGAYKYKKLTGEMRDTNKAIKRGQMLVESLYKSDVGTGRNPVLKSSVTYRGNDFKLHTAVKEATKDGSSYTNIAANTQRTFNNVRDYARAKKRYTGRY